MGDVLKPADRRKLFLLYGAPERRDGDKRPFDRLRVPSKVEGDAYPTTVGAKTALSLLSQLEPTSW